MTDGKKKRKSKSESFGKKLRTRKDTKKIQTGKTSRSSSLMLLAPPPPDDSSDNKSDTSKGSININPMDEIGNIKNITNGNDESNNPAFLLIPILGGDYNNEDDGDPRGEISMEDAFDYPIGPSGTRKRGKLRLATNRKRSPTAIKLEKARKEVEDYNSGMDGKKHTLKDQVLLMETAVSVKANIIRKMEDFEKSKSGYDQSKFNNWLRDVLQLPFGKSVDLPITLQDGAQKIQAYLDEVRSCLDRAIAGQDHVKDEIIDFIARLIANPSSRGNILALVGPPGSGKTRLVRKGIAEALKRPFHVINLGGMNDVHVLTGHDVTYTGAKYGRLAQIMIQSQCENPVIYLDEIDKIQSTHDKGMEIFRVLTHVLDDEQNHEFYDEYFSNVSINLSKILFVASLNNAESIEPVLLDRLKLIKVDELTVETKVDIVRNYMLPELFSQVAMNAEAVGISDDLIRYVIRNKTDNEEGCRQLKRKWETIVQKLNTMKITRKGAFEEKETIDLTSKLVDELLKHSDVGNKIHAQHIYS